MKQYLLTVHYVDGAPEPTAEEMERQMAETGVVNEQMKEAGVWVFAGGLLPPDVSTVVNVADGRATMTDGPFAEAKEHIAGFWVLKCDHDTALEWAAKAAVCCGPIEVRPFGEDAED